MSNGINLSFREIKAMSFINIVSNYSLSPSKIIPLKPVEDTGGRSVSRRLRKFGGQEIVHFSRLILITRQQQ